MKGRIIVTRGYDGPILEEVVVEAPTEKELDREVRATADKLWQRYPAPGHVVHGVLPA